MINIDSPNYSSILADLAGGREGTITAAMLAGRIVKFFIPRLGCLDRIFTDKTC